MIRKQVLFATLVLAATVLAGCNTMAGAGKDLKDAGNAITNSAEKHQ